MFGSRLTTDARMAFPFAMAEAQDLGHSSLRPEHMILGVLCNARDPLVAVLAEHGITLETARGAVRAVPAEPERTPTSDEDRYAEDRDALKMLGIDLDKVREAVARNFGDDLTSGWGRREDRRGGRGRRGGPGGGRRGGGRGPREDGPRDGGPGAGPWGFGGPGVGPWGPYGDDDQPGEGPWAHGRGRRGPRGQRPRFAPSTKRAISTAARTANESGSRLTTAHIVAAVLDVDDPAVAAIIAVAPDGAALRRAVEDQLTVASA